MCKSKVSDPQTVLLLRQIEVWKNKCKSLIAENGTLKRGQDLLKIENKRKAGKIKEQYEELQKMEEQLQEEVNFSNSISEVN